MKQNKNRIKWVDTWRGLAIIAMIIFHIAFGLSFLEIHTIHYYTGGWLVLARFAQISFLTLVGGSLFISFDKATHYSCFLKKQFRRALVILSSGLLLTLITFLWMPDIYIQFGILHLIAIGILITSLIIKWPVLLFFLGTLILANTPLIQSAQVNHSLWAPIGLTPENYFTLDFFPIFPWLSVVFFGAVLFYFLKYINWLYCSCWQPYENKYLAYLGRHSLMIYLVHQPIILGILWGYKFLIITLL